MGGLLSVLGRPGGSEEDRNASNFKGLEKRSRWLLVSALVVVMESLLVVVLWTRGLVSPTARCDG